MAVRCFGVASGGEFFRDGGCGRGEGRALNEPMLKTDPAAIGSREFFERSRARLRFDVPPGLLDPAVIPRSGDYGTDACWRSSPANSRFGPLRC